jgi:hypothetical protein
MRSVSGWNSVIERMGWVGLIYRRFYCTDYAKLSKWIDFAWAMTKSICYEILLVISDIKQTNTREFFK